MSDRITSLLSLLFWFVLIFGGLALVAMRFRERNTQVAPFQSYLADYFRLVSEADYPDSAKPKEGYIRGKLVAIARDDDQVNKVDELYFYVPDEIRARQPEEVGTIAFVKNGRQAVGRYNDDATAYMRTCKVTLIDKNLSIIIAEKDFEGSAPPSLKKGSDEEYGEFPHDDIAEYLAKLPRKE